MAKTNADSVTFTAREMEVLALAWQCFKTAPQMDMEKLTRLTNYKNAAVTAVMFNGIKRKLKIIGEAQDDSAPSTPPGTGNGKTASSKSTGKRRTREVDDPETPSKPAKKGRAIKKKADNDDDDEEELGSYGVIKKEELLDVQNGMNDFMNQAAGYAGDDA